MEMDVERVVERRRLERQALLAGARGFVVEVAGRVKLRAAVVIGSVARGDFNRWSDVDVLVIADELPARALDRLTLLEPRPAGVQPIAWTPAEWHREVGRGNPMAVEALERGVWLLSSPDSLGPRPASDIPPPFV
jgi:predicted nucleotidyltransferase